MSIFTTLPRESYDDRAFDGFGRGQRRNQKCSALAHQRRAFFIEKRSVFDR